MASRDASYLQIALFVGVAAGVLFLLHPARGVLAHPSPRPSVAMMVFVLAASVPLVWFGLSAASLQRNGNPADPHVQGDHWATVAAMAFGLVLAGLLASARTGGWRLTAWCTGFGLALYGLASIVFDRFPGTDIPYAGSEGIGWGGLAIASGLVFVALAEWQARRSIPE